MHASVIARVQLFLLVMLVLISVAIVGLLARRSSAGSLDPPGAPGPTMYTLNDLMTVDKNIPPAWDQKLDSTNGSAGTQLLPAGCNSDRFVCVFPRKTGLLSYDYDGVLDRETGLVWVRVPDVNLWDWGAASATCIGSAVAGRFGWRLPTVNEFMSLLDPTTNALPVGNPFSAALASGTQFWTSTASEQAGYYWYVDLGNPPGPEIGPPPNYMPGVAQPMRPWCVRGGTNQPSAEG